jgi:hypothetical protein
VPVAHIGLSQICGCQLPRSLKEENLVIKLWSDDIINSVCISLLSRPGSSVCIATGYGLDGPGIESW